MFIRSYKTLITSKIVIILVIYCFIPCLLHAQATNTWNYINPRPIGINLNAVWHSPDDKIYMVGDCGAILTNERISWRIFPPVTDSNLMGVWGDGVTEIFAVGEMGTILKYDGISWSCMTSGTLKQLNGVWGSSALDIYAVGNTGTLLHYNGLTWATISLGTFKNLYGVFGISKNSVYVVGDSGKFYHYDGIGWSPISLTTDINGRAIWGSDDTNIIIVGLGVVVRYDGISWSYETLPTISDYYSVWGTSPDNYYVDADKFDYVVGDFQSIYHFDGILWTQVVGPIPSFAYLGISGKNSSSIYSVGMAGLIVHYDGISWEQIDTAFSRDTFEGYGVLQEQISGLQETNISVVMQLSFITMAVHGMKKPLLLQTVCIIYGAVIHLIYMQSEKMESFFTMMVLHGL